MATAAARALIDNIFIQVATTDGQFVSAHRCPPRELGVVGEWPRYGLARTHVTIDTYKQTYTKSCTRWMEGKVIRYFVWLCVWAGPAILLSGCHYSEEDKWKVCCALEQRFWRLALLPQPYLVLCGLVLTLVLGGCSKPAQMVDIRKLKELKDWQAVALSDMLNKPADAVCVVRPYLTEVYEDVPFRDQINAHLKATKYQTNESEWAFAFVHG